jgi:hypothetical protein
MEINEPYSQYITINESIASYKGKISFKQYNKHKNKSFGMKILPKPVLIKDILIIYFLIRVKILIMIR